MKNLLKEQIFQLKITALQAAVAMNPAEPIELAEQIYQWLTLDIGEAKPEGALKIV